MTIAIGITGTRLGASKLQLRVLMGTLLQYYRGEPVELHHGACVGVDEQAALIARALKFKVVAHPPEIYKHRSLVSYDASSVVLPEDEYLARDRAIVDQTTFIIAIPLNSVESVRSGTWYTYNYAIAQSKVSMLILPDGTVR